MPSHANRASLPPLTAAAPQRRRAEGHGRATAIGRRPEGYDRGGLAATTGAIPCHSLQTRPAALLAAAAIQQSRPFNATYPQPHARGRPARFTVAVRRPHPQRRPRFPLDPRTTAAAATPPTVVRAVVSTATSHAAVLRRHVYAGTTAVVL